MNQPSAISHQPSVKGPRNVQLRKRFDFRTHANIGMVSVVGGTGKGHFYCKRSQLAKTLRRLRRMQRSVLTPAITEQFRPLSRFSTLLKPDYPPQKEGGVK